MLKITGNNVRNNVQFLTLFISLGAMGIKFVLPVMLILTQKGVVIVDLNFINRQGP